MRLPVQIAPSLVGYQPRWLGRDLTAGIVLSALLVPQGMAYAELAGLPAVTGLYTSILCLVGYALVGPSKVLVLGPDSSLGPMIAATVLPLAGAGGDPAKAVVLASALAIITGGLMVAAGAAKLGFVADLLSRPTVLGYMNGLALTIVVGQIPKLFGFSVDADSFIEEAGGVVAGLTSGEVVPTAAGIGLLSLVVILLLGRLTPRVPGVLVAVVLATGLSSVLNLSEHDVSVIGSLPEGLPSFTVPLVSLADLGLLIAGAAGISLVALADTISTATSFAERQGAEVDGSQEMVGIGAANVAAGVFQGFPVSTSGSRTAVAEQAGSRSQLTGLVGAGMIALMLTMFPSLLAALPQPTLAAIVIAAALSLADIAGMRRLYVQRRTDFVVGVTAFLGVAFLGVLSGILVAVIFSVSNVFRRIWRPHTATLGRATGLPGLHDVEDLTDAQILTGCPVYRFDAPLIFANAPTFRDEVRRIAGADPPPTWIVVAAEPISDIDTTACDVLEELVPVLDRQGTRLLFAELKSPVLAKVRAYGVDVLPRDRIYPTVEAAVNAFEREHGADWRHLKG